MKSLLATGLILTISVSSFSALAINQLGADALNAHIEGCFAQTRAEATPSTFPCNKVIRSNRVSKHNKAVALHNRAIVLLKQAKTDKALRDFTRAVSLSPDMLESLLATAQLLYQKQDFQLAQKYFDIATKIDAEHPTIVKYRNKGLQASVSTTQPTSIK